MSVSKKDNYRDRAHCLLLYPDCESHMKALEIIKRSYDYACILHDKDIQANGELKKPHYHIVIRFNQARWASAICSELGIDENYIEKPRSFVNALMYLIHFNDADKVQYGLDDVTGSLQSRLAQEISKVDKTESEKILELLDYIDSMAEYISVKSFMRYCASMGYWSEFRRASALFVHALEEHNKRLCADDNTREF